MYGTLEVSTSALVAQRTNLNVIAGNIAMKDSMRMVNGEWTPYRRKVALMAPGNANDPSKAGVRVDGIVDDPSPFSLRHDPTHEHAYKSGKNKGYVPMSNVNYHTEMVNALTAARAFEANVSVIEISKSMASSTLRLLA